MKRSADHYLNHGNTRNNHLFIRPVLCINRGTHRRAHGTFRGPSTLRRLRNVPRNRFVRGCFNDYRDRCTNPTKTARQLLPEQDASGWDVKGSHESIITHPQAQLERGSVFFAFLLLCVRPFKPILTPAPLKTLRREEKSKKQLPNQLCFHPSLLYVFA